MNLHEYEALDNEYLSLPAQVLYMKVLRRFMDYSTGLVGTENRRISYQQFKEQLSVFRRRGSTEPEFVPSRQNLRGYVAELEQAGLVVRLPKQHARDPMVFRLPLASVCSYEEQPRNNQSRQPKAQPEPAPLEQGMATDGQPKEQPTANHEQQQTSVTSEYHSLSSSRGGEDDEHPVFRNAREPASLNSDGFRVTGRKFALSHQWQPDNTLAVQALQTGFDLSAVDSTAFGHALAEFRLYWTEEQPGRHHTQRTWQQKFIESLKRYMGKGDANATRRTTDRSNYQAQRADTIDAIWNSPGCESLGQDDYSDVFGQ